MKWKIIADKYKNLQGEEKKKKESLAFSSMDARGTHSNKNQQKRGMHPKQTAALRSKLTSECIFLFQLVG